MGMSIEDRLNASAAGILDTMTANKVKKTQKAFASFMDNAVNSKSGMSTDSADKYVVASEASDTKQNIGKDDNSGKTTESADKKTVKSEDKSAKVTETGQTETKVEEVAPEEDVQVVSEIEQAIMSMLAQELGITIEELQQTLKDMGIGAIDLLDNTKLLEFTMQINGIDDISLVLTDENLMAQYKDLVEEVDFAVENVLKENDIPAEQLPELIETFKADVNTNAVNVDVSDRVAATNAVNTTTVEVKVENPVKNVDDNVDVPDVKTVEAGEKPQQEDSAAFSEQEEGNLQKDNGNSWMQQRRESLQQDAPIALHPQQNQPLNTIVNSLGNATVSYSSADMAEIVNQVVEQIKVEVNADTSTMEMQLNPESLGKLQLHVALKDGMVTAQMTVENEAVRHALEMQVVQLRESMNNQGLKVEAIEVTVASHEFDRNLQQESNANQQAFEEEQQKAAGKRMNLNLNLDNWDEGELEGLSEAEVLERKIMLESGNRMSIQA